MDDINYALELAAFSEKTCLAKLEVARAQQRVEELVYEEARFKMEWLRLAAKAQQETAKQKAS